MKPVTYARRRLGCDVIVVGGGIGGLTAAHTIAAECPDASIVVLEATDRPGGQVVTTTAHGYTFEHGATSLMLRGPETSLLVDRLGLRESLRPAAPAGLRGFFYTGGMLRALPRSPRAAARSSLLSTPGKLRALAEPLLARPNHGREETVYEFAARRFGDEFARVIATTALQAVTGGDARKTSLSAVFPELHDLDASAGRDGLLGALVRSRSEASRTAGDGPKGACTFRDGGLQRLVDALALALGNRIRYHAQVRELQHSGEAFAATLASGEVLESRHVVVAVPPSRAALLFSAMAPEASAALLEVRNAGIRVIGLGYTSTSFQNGVPGLGFLVPPGEGKGVLGAIFSSNLFPDQAPADHVLVRAFLGGAFSPGAVDESLDIAVARVQEVLRGAYGLRAEPDFVLDAPWPDSIPQYERGHIARLDRLDAALAPFHGLRLVGFGAVGLPAAIRSATEAGRGVAAELSTSDDAPVPAIHSLSGNQEH
jgi:oxygen-dependent protoporphyrinogen oxidase